MLKRLVELSAACAFLIAGAAFGQTVGGQPAQDPDSTQPVDPLAPPPAPEPPPAPVRPTPAPDAELDSLMSMLSGSWKTQTTEPDTGNAVELWMHVAPLWVNGIDRALYAEFHRAGDIDRPYRQAVFEFYRFKNTIRLRTLEFKRGAERAAVLGGLWPAPEFLPMVERADLIATLDVELKPSGAGFTGKTPYAYPTAERGAVEMTSEVTLTPDSFKTIDRGYDASGKLAWGGDSGYSWTRGNPGVVVERRESGLIIIDLVRPTEGRISKEGDVAVMHYTGWISDGKLIQSTRESNMPYRTNLPFEGIPAWTEGLIGVIEGTKRRLVAPPALAFGPDGRGPIPPNSTMFFEIEMLKVEDQPNYEPAPAPEPPPQAGDDNADGGGSDGASGRP